MSEQTPQDIFADMNVSKILVSILETIGEVKVSTSNFMDAGAEHKELQVDYNEDDQTFVFKLRDKESNDN
jgi:uncharacterized protein involved in type VI secretion and phage assembly